MLSSTLLLLSSSQDHLLQVARTKVCDYEKEFISVQSDSWVDSIKEVIFSLLDKTPLGAGLTKERSNEILLEVLNVLEALPIVFRLLKSTQSAADLLAVFLAAYKMISSKSIILSAIDFGTWFTRLITDVFADVQVPTVQTSWLGSTSSTEGFEYCLSGAKTLLNNYKGLRDSYLVKKFQIVMKYFLCFGLFQNFGLTFDHLNYSKYERLHTMQEFSSWEGFIRTLLESTVWFLERGMQSIKTGSFSPFFHSSETYSAWYDVANRLREDALKLQNPEATGVDEHKFMHDLNDAIENGEAIEKYASEKSEKKIVSGLLRELRLIKAQIATKKAAQRDRKAPFSVLVSGDSCVGKSKFTTLLFQHYGKVMGKSTDEEYMYARCAADKYWSGFNTSKWCIRLDDVAMLSTKLGVLDPSMVDMLQIVNSVPFTPPMADLADKGTCPVRPDFVIATTNQEDMNAAAYFACPLAVRRRFPYVFDISAKPEFCQDILVQDPADPSRTIRMQSGMLDGRKIPPLEPGEYQNTWHIIVKKVCAQMNGARATVDMQVMAQFDDIYEFVAFFSHLIREHSRCQDSDSLATEVMKAVEVCRGCHVPVSHCFCDRSVQTRTVDEILDQQIEADVLAWRRRMARMWLQEEEEVLPLDDTSDEDSLDYSYTDERSFTTKCADTIDDVTVWIRTYAACQAACLKVKWDDSCQYLGEKAGDLILLYQVRRCKRILTDLGKQIAESLNVWNIAGFCAVLLTAWGIYKTASSMATLFIQTSEESVDVKKVPVQKVVASFDHDEKPNCWVKDEFTLSEFNVGCTTSGWKNQPFAQSLEKIAKNVVHLEVEFSHEGLVKHIPSTALCVSGHVYLTNNHCFPLESDDGMVRVYMTEMNNPNHIGSNINFPVSLSKVYRDQDKDVLMFWSPYPPRMNLLNLFLEKDFPQLVCNGFYVGKAISGEICYNPLQRIHAETIFAPGCLQKEFESFVATPRNPTAHGDCGTPMVANSPAGPLLVGIHQTGNGSMCTAIRLTRGEIQKGVDFFGFNVEAGIPNLYETKLGSLHEKSVLRWPSEGQARVYGTALNRTFRASPKSHVAKTLISEAAQAQGFVKRCGQPCMKGAEPWHKGIAETLSLQFQLNPDLLDECANSYAQDILEGLDEEDLSELIVLDDKTTLNGYPGVKFLDKMNRQTSMGFPYRKSKQFFLKELPPDDVWANAVEFDSEVMQEVRRIEEEYSEGRRVMPVFTASLKDEPLPQEKIDIKKTRVFMGAPAAWSFVVRKYLLSFIRVFQRNSFLFEGAPGVNCKSDQWSKYYHFLCQFGRDRMIAGDYSKYDKRMEPALLLAAFKVMITILRKAGWSESELLKIACIAEDTAYPLVDFQGDFVELFGSNPSGGPLTVIINCIANSIYMRMAYSVLSPNKSPRSFRNHVALATYGDDNGMGVKRGIDWFNHTNIQSALAKWGVVYTMADKHAESVPFLDISDISFLKRKWRWDEDVGAYLCPLEWASLDKMLTMGIASKSVCPEEQAVSVITSAMSEFWQYGRETFEDNKKKMMRIVEDCHLQLYVNSTTFQSWDDHHAVFLRNCSSHKGSINLEPGLVAKTTVEVAFDLHDGPSKLSLSHCN